MAKGLRPGGYGIAWHTVRPGQLMPASPCPLRCGAGSRSGRHGQASLLTVMDLRLFFHNVDSWDQGRLYALDGHQAPAHDPICCSPWRTRGRCTGYRGCQRYARGSIASLPPGLRSRQLPATRQRLPMG